MSLQAKRSSWRHLANPFPPASSEWGVGEGEEWWEGVDVWNQVFRLRFSGIRHETPKLSNDTGTLYMYIVYNSTWCMCVYTCIHVHPCILYIHTYMLGVFESWLAIKDMFNPPSQFSRLGIQVP